jgi:hypothetical protein
MKKLTDKPFIVKHLPGARSYQRRGDIPLP